MNSSVYQSLKSQFSVLYQQADILKRQAEDARQTHENMRTVSFSIILKYSFFFQKFKKFLFSDFPQTT